MDEEKTAGVGPVAKVARALNIRWPETRPEDCVFDISDDEDED
jgi:hypothetical protein